MKVVEAAASTRGAQLLLCRIGDIQDCLFEVTLDAANTFRAVRHNVLTGFYRFSLQVSKGAQQRLQYLVAVP
jgi:hypothetical protein